MKRIAVFLLIRLACALPADAQSVSQAGQAERTLHTPAVSISAGVGPVGRYQGVEWRTPALFASAHVQVAPFVVVQATATEWTWHRDRQILFASADEHWKTRSFGGNVGLRAASGRVAGIIGVGLGIQHSTLLGSSCYAGCEARPPDRQFASHAVRISPSLQFAGSGDFQIAPHLVAFGELLMIAGNEGALGTFGGLRVPLGSRTFHKRIPELFPTAAAARFEGERVRLTTADGKRHKGRLLTLSLSEVVLATDAAIMHVPLQDVQRLEKTSTKGLRMGTLLGTGAGVYAGLAAGEVGQPGAEIWPVFVFSAVGAGIGAGIGMVIDSVRADRHLIYLAGSNRSIGVKPFANRRGSGLELAFLF